MRIAYLHGATIPSRAASTVQVMKMCEAMASLGHAVLLVVPDKPDRLRDAEPFQFYDVKPIFRLALAKWLRVRYGSYVCAIAMAALARRFNPAMIYSRFLAATFFGFLCSVRSKVVHELHRPYEHFATIDKCLFRLLTRFGRVHWVCISGALAQHYAFQFPSLRDRILVAHDAADENTLDDAGDSRQITDARLRVGYVGSLHPGKGAELVAALAARCPYADFHLLGGLPEQVDQLRAKTGQRSNLHIHGHVSHATAKGWLPGFDVLLAPYGERVGVYGDAHADISPFMSPLKLFEYMAAGRAIVCSDHSVLLEVITPEVDALVCERGNLDQWAAALRRLQDDPDLRIRLGASARLKCSQNFTWKQRAARVLGPPVANDEHL